MSNNIIVGNLDDLDKEYSPDRTALNKFMKEVESHITSGCMIPINLPKSEIFNIIIRAKQWFVKNYYDAVRVNYYIIPREYFKTETYKKTRCVRFKKFDYTDPKWDGSGDIVSVIEVHQINNERHISTKYKKINETDFDIERNMLRTLGSDSARGGEELMAYVIDYSYYDLFRQIIKSTVSYDYNSNSKSLRFLGKDLNDDIMLVVNETIEDESLFFDELFFRYVVAKVKIQLGRQFSMFGYNLPGEVEFNGSELKDMGQEELDAIIEEVTGAGGVDRADWFLTD